MKLKRTLCSIVLHTVIVLSLVFLTFIVLDWYNPLMGFLSNPSSNALLIALCVLSIVSSVSCIANQMQERGGRTAPEHMRRKQKRGGP